MITALMLSLAVHASPYSEGLRFMQEGQLDQAIAIWQPLSEEDDASAELHYNLGVAYYRKQALAEAIYQWRVAHLLKPRDGDVVHNLALARARTDGTPRPAPMPVGWMELMTTGELGAISGLLTTAASIGAWTKRALLPWLVLGVAGLFGVSIALSGQTQLEKHPTAVLMTDAPLRAIPSIDALPQKTLRAGSELRVQQELGEFILLNAGDSSTGWLPKNAVTQVKKRR